MRSASFVAEYPQNVSFFVESHCYEHWLLQLMQDAATEASAAALYQISEEDIVYLFVPIYNLGLHWDTVFPQEAQF